MERRTLGPQHQRRFEGQLQTACQLINLQKGVTRKPNGHTETSILTGILTEKFTEQRKRFESFLFHGAAENRQNRLTAGNSLNDMCSECNGRTFS